MGVAREWYDRSKAEWERSNREGRYLNHFDGWVFNVEHGTVTMSALDLDRLSEYSTSTPTGVYLRKCWKARVGSTWFLRYYGWSSDGPKYAAIKSYRIIAVTEAQRIALEELERLDQEEAAA